MIQIITGQTGEGKTKKMINLANEQKNKLKGQIVYVDSTSQHRLDLSHKIRLIEANTFPINPSDFFGFLCGILSSNHDIELIFIDELVKMTQLGIDQLASFIQKLKMLSDRYNVNFVIGTSCATHELPSDLLDYLSA